MDIYLDFDGTVVEHQWPKMGAMNPGAIEVLIKLQEAGHKIHLNTYRADLDFNSLRESVDFLNSNGINVSGVCPVKVHPSPLDWNQIKESDTLYIDDIAPDTPLIAAKHSLGNMVCWESLDIQFQENGMYEAV